MGYDAIELVSLWCGRERLLNAGETPAPQCFVEAILVWAAAIFVATFTASLAIFALLILVLPPRYFAEDRKLWKGSHPAVRLAGLIGKNALGVGLVVLGLLLSLPGIPGQGLLTVALGVMLLDIPGKHRLVGWVVKRKGVLKNLNRFRAWFGRPPLVVNGN